MTKQDLEKLAVGTIWQRWVDASEDCAEVWSPDGRKFEGSVGCPELNHFVLHLEEVEHSGAKTGEKHKVHIIATTADPWDTTAKAAGHAAALRSLADGKEDQLGHFAEEIAEFLDSLTWTRSPIG